MLPYKTLAAPLSYGSILVMQTTYLRTTYGSTKRDAVSKLFLVQDFSSTAAIVLSFCR